MILRKEKIKTINEYYEIENHILLKIIHKENKYEPLKVMVDKEDFLLISNFHWYGDLDKHTKKYYIMSWFKGKNIRIHRIIMKTPDHLVVDHLNLDTLDNRKFNLKNCTTTENIRNNGIYSNNTTGLKGVSFENNKYGGKFIVTWNTYKINGEKIRNKNSFSVNKYGYEQAKFLAFEHRKEIESINCLRPSTSDCR